MVSQEHSFHQNFEEIAANIETAHCIGIISHRSPDGDTIGCNLALRYALQSRGKKILSFCIDPVPEKFTFLKDAAYFQSVLTLQSVDMLISVDVAAKKMLGFEEQQPELLAFKPFINIDHHPDNDRFGTLPVVDGSAAAAALMVFDLIRFLNIPLTRDIATALMVGLSYDTGSFMHSNTSSRAYHVAGQLLLAGADMRSIVQNLFQHFPINRLRLWGEVLKRAKMNQQKVVSSVVTKHDFDTTATSSEDLNGVVEYLNMVPGSEFALLLTEDEEERYVKGSLRTLQDDVDVSQIAHKYGGGGHKKASGFRVPGRIEEEVIWKVVNDKNDEVIHNIGEL
jgi:bifunctional oligoribonuclease and PAP phosphatase NrnA